MSKTRIVIPVQAQLITLAKIGQTNIHMNVMATLMFQQKVLLLIILGT